LPDSPTPAVVYAAKSTEDQRGSIPTQTADCRAMAERQGWEVVGEFSDEGFSAYKGNRGPGLERAKQAAVRAAEDRSECMLVVQHTDRLARGAGDRPGAADHLGEVYFWARRHAVRLRSVQDDANLEDALRAVLIGERNTEDSQRKSQAVSAGKDRQIERGERLGGPVPDGLTLAVERDDRDRVVARRYTKDPERGPIIERIFDLSEQGYGDAVVARAINAEGHPTKNGKPWTRRRVQDTLLNQVYAGRAVRASKGGKRLKEPEVVTASNLEALIEPERYDRIVAARADRDRVAARGRDGLRKGDRGRGTTRYALAKLGACDRCGERMYATTSPYKRKDGTQRRSYVCANYKNSTGLCDQKPLDAEKIDTAVLAYLDRLFIDFDGWLAQINDAKSERARTIEGELRGAEKEAERLQRIESRIEARYMKLMDEGEERKAGTVERVLDRAQRERAEQDERVRFLNGELARADEPTPTDPLLDYFNRLSEAVRGGSDGSLGEVNERLRAHFQEFRLDRVDEETVGVQPILRGEIVARDLGAAHREWIEAGEPKPTAGEVEAYERERDAEEPIWVSGDEVIAPPAKPLTVPMKRGRNTQL
jgi:site-specific DNA recombinase